MGGGQDIPLECWDAEMLELPGQFLHSQYKEGREIVFVLVKQVSYFIINAPLPLQPITASELGNDNRMLCIKFLHVGHVH